MRRTVVSSPPSRCICGFLSRHRALNPIPHQTILPRQTSSPSNFVRALHQPSRKPTRSSRAPRRPPPPRRPYEELDEETTKGWKFGAFLKANAVWALLGIFVIGGFSYFEDRYIRKTDEDLPALNEYMFLPFTLVDKESTSPTSAIITLRPAPKSLARKNEKEYPDSYDAFWEKGLWSIEIKQPQLQISRRYTPLPPLSELEQHTEGEKVNTSGTGDIRLLVRREPEGEVSRYLHDLQLGAPVEVRGGYVDYKLSRAGKRAQDITNVLFIAGGTGIAPALQAAYSLMQLQKRDADQAQEKADQESGQPESSIKMTILWANRERADCQGGRNTTKPHTSVWAWNWFRRKEPTMDIETNSTEPGQVVRELDALQTNAVAEKSRVEVNAWYFVDEERTFIQAEDISDALAQESKTSSATQNRRRLILISGPDGFVDYVAGPKALRDGIEVQGPVAGLLSRINHQGWEVWKL